MVSKTGKPLDQAVESKENLARHARAFYHLHLSRQ
jgi:hypothetical protein